MESDKVLTLRTACWTRSITDLREAVAFISYLIFPFRGKRSEVTCR